MSTLISTQGNFSGVTSGTFYTATVDCMVAITVTNKDTAKVTLVVNKGGYALFYPTLYATENGRTAVFEKTALLAGQSLAFTSTANVNVDYQVWGYTDA